MIKKLKRKWKRLDSQMKIEIIFILECSFVILAVLYNKIQCAQYSCTMDELFYVSGFSFTRFIIQFLILVTCVETLVRVIPLEMFSYEFGFLEIRLPKAVDLVKVIYSSGTGLLLFNYMAMNFAKL